MHLLIRELTVFIGKMHLLIRKPEKFPIKNKPDRNQGLLCRILTIQ